MKRIKILLTCLAFFIIYGCSSIPNPPLLFGQQQTLGLSIAVSERASDLPWILAIRNDSKKTVDAF